jgi:hypothetical protein
VSIGPESGHHQTTVAFPVSVNDPLNLLPLDLEPSTCSEETCQPSLAPVFRLPLQPSRDRNASTSKRFSNARAAQSSSNTYTGRAGDRLCRRTVDFMSLYPTLMDLCGIPTPKHVEGVSIRKLLKDPDSAWDRPALTTYLFNNHAVRTEQWRYIRYHDGGEELYDESKDPLEWTNLAGKPRYASLKAALARHFPKVNTPPPSGSSSADRLDGKRGAGRGR